jgi:hypothetical protein
MKLSCLMLCALPLMAVSCASYDVARNGECIPLERDETRRYDNPRVVSSDPDSVFNDVALQKGRVGLVAARF